MYTNEEMEIMLWDYIDGVCTGTEKMLVQELIATDRVWQERYEQYMRLHSELQQSMETEQPSLRFTKNVMENIAASTIARPAKTYVNKWVVRSIAAFFIVTLGIVVIAAISSIAPGIDFSGDKSLLPAFVKNISFGQIFNGNTVMLSITVCAITGLIFLDTYRSRVKRLKG